MPNRCPKCEANLEGELIYETFLKQTGNEADALRYAEMYGATKTEGRWGLAIGMYDFDEDRTVEWQCRFCNHRWSR